ncbi:ABC transporter substrate-binding protein [Candidatus Falkowbacteria bacterium]|jgi:sulfonate transport system substrate-binding protein|nr:ABC transporter substrate-binding protein [Candidatus Falkowbacteria bacterium]MBT4433457.1 ABC transporter substrate-binding protein [Candidatus Falkowbacteria bacterium]
MKNNWVIVILALAVGVFIGYQIGEKEIDSLSEETKELTKVRIGWQIPWATEGQLTQILKHTDLLKDNNLEGDFKGFSYGGPLNEAALAGEVDVVFTADQPAAMLLNKNPEWTIIARLMYNRTSLYVPPKSDIQDVVGLKGKTVAMPFGAAAQRMALAEEQKAGLDPKIDVNNINLGIYEQSDLVKDPEATKWGEIDALAGFDPTPAILEEKGLVRNLAVGKIVSVILMNNEYIKNNPDAPKQFLTAFNGAYKFYRNNIEQSDTWFAEEAKLDITPKALEIAASIEPNVNANSDEEIYIDFKEEDYAIMQEAADFLFGQEMIDKQITMKDYIDLSYLK